jgi:TRAP-type C4-dicarboxylate transport system permease small subunit
MSNKWAAAIVLLAVCIVFAAAGVQALSASYQQTTETRNASSAYADQSPPVLETGRDAGATITTLLPTLAFVAVPLGILGVLTLGGVIYTTNQSSGGVHR